MDSRPAQGPRWTVTDDTRNRRLAAGYEPFVKQEIGYAIRNLGHGESITLTITRDHDNAQSKL